MYAIRNINDSGLAWSNEFGWVDDESYDLFTDEEANTLNLPIEGRWSYIGPDPSESMPHP
jgi:hypothetical protein